MHSIANKLLIVPALAAIVSSAGAQDAPLLTPGARLRVTVSRPLFQVRIAQFEALTDTALVVSGAATSVSIPYGTITRLELSSGRRPSVLGGVVGLIIGGAIGAALACNANRDSYGVFCGGQDDTKLIIGAGLGAAAGGAAGAFLFRRERWTAVDLSQLQRPR